MSTENGATRAQRPDEVEATTAPVNARRAEGAGTGATSAGATRAQDPRDQDRRDQDPRAAAGDERPLDLGRPRGSRTLVDRLMRSLVWLAATLALVPLLWILLTVFGKGAPMLFTAEPTYTRICAVEGHAPDPTYDTHQRVADSECQTNADGAKYRWLAGGKYPAVGQFVESNVDAKSMDPTKLNPSAVIGYPGSDKAGTIRTFSTQWWTQDAGKVPDQMQGGGMLHALVGTLWIGLICSVIAIPLGLLGAYYLVEYARGKRSARVVSFMVDILTGVPSIVAALFVYAVVITLMGFERSTFAAALALVLLMLPTVLRSTEEMLKLVPDSLREASYALGVPKWKTITSVVTPTAFGGIATGVILGIARVMGETAPLLILLNYARNTNLNPFGNTMGTLPTMIANAAALPENYPGSDRGWGAACTLILLVMGLNLLARWIGRRSKTK